MHTHLSLCISAAETIWVGPTQFIATHQSSWLASLDFQAPDKRYPTRLLTAIILSRQAYFMNKRLIKLGTSLIESSILCYTTSRIHRFMGTYIVQSGTITGQQSTLILKNLDCLSITHDIRHFLLGYLREKISSPTFRLTNKD